MWCLLLRIYIVFYNYTFYDIYDLPDLPDLSTTNIAL